MVCPYGRISIIFLPFCFRGRLFPGGKSSRRQDGGRGSQKGKIPGGSSHRDVLIEMVLIEMALMEKNFLEKLRRQNVPPGSRLRKPEVSGFILCLPLGRCSDVL